MRGNMKALFKKRTLCLQLGELTFYVRLFLRYLLRLLHFILLYRTLLMLLYCRFSRFSLAGHIFFLCFVVREEQDIASRWDDSSVVSFICYVVCESTFIFLLHSSMLCYILLGMSSRSFFFFLYDSEKRLRRDLVYSRSHFYFYLFTLRKHLFVPCSHSGYLEPKTHIHAHVWHYSSLFLHLVPLWECRECLSFDRNPFRSLAHWALVSLTKCVTFIVTA